MTFVRPFRLFPAPTNSPCVYVDVEGPGAIPCKARADQWICQGFLGRDETSCVRLAANNMLSQVLLSTFFLISHFFSHFKVENWKSHHSIFWTSDPIRMTKRRKSLHLFNFYLLFLRKYKELLVHEDRGNEYGPGIHFLLARYSRSFLIENAMVDPKIKWRKSKGGATSKKASKKRPYQSVCRCWEDDFSICVYRTSTLPFFSDDNRIIGHETSLSLISASRER